VFPVKKLPTAHDVQVVAAFELKHEAHNELQSMVAIFRSKIPQYWILESFMLVKLLKFTNRCVEL
jgi:hypothetical protein